MSELLIEGSSEVRLMEGEISSVSKNNLKFLFKVAELKQDFTIHCMGTEFYLQRKDSNLYDSPGSIVFITLHEDASLSLNYIGQEEVVMNDISDKSIEDVYELLTIVNDAIKVEEDCIRVFAIHNFKELFKDTDLLSKFTDYIKQDDMYVAVD